MAANVRSSHQASDLPGGTVTFLFTDIQGSTQLLDQLRDGYATLLEEHHRLLRAAFEKWHGQEVDTQGDAILVSGGGRVLILPVWNSTQELVDYARDCCVLRPLTPEEREMFGLAPLEQ